MPSAILIVQWTLFGLHISARALAGTVATQEEKKVVKHT